MYDFNTITGNLIVDSITGLLMNFINNPIQTYSNFGYGLLLDWVTIELNNNFRIFR